MANRERILCLFGILRADTCTVVGGTNCIVIIIKAEAEVSTVLKIFNTFPLPALCVVNSKFTVFLLYMCLSFITMLLHALSLLGGSNCMSSAYTCWLWCFHVLRRSQTPTETSSPVHHCLCCRCDC